MLNMSEFTSCFIADYAARGKAKQAGEHASRRGAKEGGCSGLSGEAPGRTHIAQLLLRNAPMLSFNLCGIF